MALAGCGDSTPDRREALRPEEQDPRYPGLEVNPPDIYEYMEKPLGSHETSASPAELTDPDN